MKKIKMALAALAIVAGVGSAFAMKIKSGPECFDLPQYYKCGDGYVPAGQLGIDYDCDWDPSATCTYYEADPVNRPGEYVICHTGNIYLAH
jgi:hypothetical protein